MKLTNPTRIVQLEQRAPNSAQLLHFANDMASDFKSDMDQDVSQEAEFFHSKSTDRRSLIGPSIIIMAIVWFSLFASFGTPNHAIARTVVWPIPCPAQDDQERDFSDFSGRIERNRASRLDEFDLDKRIGDKLIRGDDQPLIGKLEGSMLYLDIGATVHFIDDVLLSARESGQIAELDVKEGDAFAAKDLLGRQDDSLLRMAHSQAKLRYDIAMEKATDRTNLLAAQKREELARTKYQRTKNLAEKGSAPENELEVAQYEYELGILGVEAARNEQKQAEAEMRLEEERMQEALERINRHQLFVDFDGYVVQILKQKFEWANAGEPVLRVARMDRLEIHALVSAELVNPHQIVKGQQVTVTLMLANQQQEKFTGIVSSVPLMREGSDVFRIKAEVQNRMAAENAWMLQPQAKVGMVVDLGSK